MARCPLRVIRVEVLDSAMKEKRARPRRKMTRSASSRRCAERKTLHPLLVDFLSYYREYDRAPRHPADDLHGLEGHQVAANADLAPQYGWREIGWFIVCNGDLASLNRVGANGGPLM